MDRILKEVYHPVLPMLTYICHYHTVVLFQVLVGPFRNVKQNTQNAKHRPGDSMWPFHPLVGGHLTISKGHLTISKRSRLESPGRCGFRFLSSAPSGIDVSHTHRLHVTGVGPEEIQRQNAPEVDQIGPCSSHRIHGAGIFTYIFSLIFYGKCRWIYHT